MWFDRTREYRARKRGRNPTKYEFAKSYPIVLEPLPCWVDLPEAARRPKARELVAEIEERAKRYNREKRRTPLGVSAIPRPIPT